MQLSRGKKKGKQSLHRFLAENSTNCVFLGDIITCLKSKRFDHDQRRPLSEALPHLTPNPTPSLLRYTQQPPAFEKLMRSTCLCSMFAQVLNTVSLLFGRTFNQGTPPFRGHKFFAQKNVEIIFVYVTSNPAYKPLFSYVWDYIRS